MMEKKPTRICNITNIEWDIYDDEIPEAELVDIEKYLPKEYSFECEEDDTPETAIDFLSDQFGWCVKNCDVDFIYQ